MDLFFSDLPVLTRYYSCTTSPWVSPVCYRHQLAPILWEKKKILHLCCLLGFLGTAFEWLDRVFQELGGSAAAVTREGWGLSGLCQVSQFGQLKETPREGFLEEHPWSNRATSVQMLKIKFKHLGHLLCPDFIFFKVLIYPSTLSLLLQALVSGLRKNGLMSQDAEILLPADRTDGAGSSSGWSPGSPLLPGRMLHQGPKTALVASCWSRVGLNGAQPSVNLLFLLKC